MREKEEGWWWSNGQKRPCGCSTSGRRIGESTQWMDVSPRTITQVPEVAAAAAAKEEEEEEEEEDEEEEEKEEEEEEEEDVGRQ